MAQTTLNRSSENKQHQDVNPVQLPVYRENRSMKGDPFEPVNNMMKSDNAGYRIETLDAGMDKHDVFSMCVHDMKTPVMVAKAFLSKLSSRISESLNENEASYFDIVKGNLDKLDRLIKEIMEFVHLERYEPRLGPVNIIRTVMESIGDMKAAADEKNIRIYFYQKKGLHELTPVVRGDQGMIKRAVTNLLENAVKYTYPEGVVTVQLSSMEDRLVIQIQDTGIGIPEHLLPYVFAPFYRCNSYAEGTGLGLFFVKAIVEGHGGQIHAESSNGKGSTFSFTLPIWKEPVRREA
ncbi:MAG: HAMP domain-containing sensor histidine kinase [Nitrospirota bacterium]